MTLDEQRLSLLAQIESAERDLAQIKMAKSDATADDEHDPEGSTLTADWQLVSASLESARAQLAATDRALERIEEGTYGTCLTCGRDIAPARLAVRPAAEDCIDCASLTR
jgi:RNA polymerase-binding transcription factor DksA